MRKNKKSCSISEFCRNNNFRTLEFYKMPRRHPELARKMKANSAGERMLDEVLARFPPYYERFSYDRFSRSPTSKGHN